MVSRVTDRVWSVLEGIGRDPWDLEDLRWWNWRRRRRAARREACVRAGTHDPRIMDMGRFKMCLRCGEW